MRAPRLLLPSLALVFVAACQSGPKKADPQTQLEIYRETANVYYAMGDRDRAESQALKGLEIDRRDAPLRRLMARISLERGETADLLRAQAIYKELVSENDKDTQSRIGLAQAQERLGVVSSQTADAIERGDRLPKRGTPAQRVLELRAEATRYWRDAIAHYERTLSERSGSLSSLGGLQRTHSRLGEWEKSLDYSNRLIEVTRNESRDFKRLIERGNLRAQAEADLRASERRARTMRLDTHMLASDLLVQLGRPEEALAHLDEALELAPDRLDALGRRAELRHRLGDQDGAIADLDAFLRQSPLPYEHPDVRKAYELRSAAEAARHARTGAARAAH